MTVSKCIFGLISLFLFSCASYRPNQDYMTEKAFREKPALKKSILDGAALNESEAQKVLNSRIQLPKKVKLAVLRMKSSVTNLSHFARTGDLKSDNIDDNFVNSFYKTLEENGNILSVIPVPPSLVAESMNINDIRGLAIRMQAHLILVVDANSDLNTDFKFFEQDTAKSITSADGYLIDSLTGVILTSGTYTDLAEVSKNSKDYDHAETMKRAKLESEKKVFGKIAKDVSAFLKKVQ